MQLRLLYREQTSGPIAGAFVPGGSPMDWFRELDRWNVDLHTLRCRIMPESISSDTGSGLFVVFGKELPDKVLIRYPYTCIADRLFIPQQSGLWPVVGADELKSLLLWDLQVFHPVIGLVGFEAKDEIELASFVHLRPAVVSDWSFAHPGSIELPILQRIGLEIVEEPENVMDSLKDDVGSKPLEEIPGVDPDETAIQKYSKPVVNALEQLGLYFILMLALIGKVLLMPFSWFFTGEGARSDSSSKGLFQKMEEWVGQRLADLEKKRDSELKRLMDLFDKDTDEALQYAIPLSSTYLNRGTAPPSARLTRRSTDFNLRNLGGGRRVDGWNLDAYNQQLRQRYEKAANDAVAAGNYKRAAYIYAHLLGNFYSAANVLQQGKLFREAAALYREHVKNDRMAAECLEKGGLLDEALTIYLELDQTEKVGDLYRKLGREGKAELYYRKTIEELRSAKAYQKAATVLVDKLSAKEEAKALLLDGWKDTGHPEACLTDYLELSRDAEEQHLAREVNYLYHTHVPRLKRTAFLNVLTDIHRRFPEPNLRDAALGIAYEVVSQQVASNDTSALKLIGNFLPQDRLLASDANRFIQSGLKLPPVYTKPDYVQLRNDTSWYHTVTFHDQLLGMGMRNGEIHFLRANWEGKLTYQFLFKITWPTSPLRLLADSGLSNHVFIVAENMKTRVDQKLAAYSYFEREVVLKTLDWLPQGGLLGCCINGEQGVSVLHYDIHGLMLSHFTMDGKQLRNQKLQLNNDGINPGQILFDPYRMIWRKGHFYCGIGELLIRIDGEGIVEILNLGAGFLKMAITDVLTALKIVVLTTEGCLWVTPSLKEMKLTSGFFGREIAGQEIKLMTDNRLVIAGGKRAAVYELKNHSPGLHGMIETEEDIKGIISIPKRHYCAFLDGNSHVSIYKIQTD